jgi:hypothetical protein
MSTIPQQKTSVFPSLASQGEIDGEMTSSKDSTASKYEEVRVPSLPLGPAALLAVVFLGYFLAG